LSGVSDRRLTFPVALGLIVAAAVIVRVIYTVTLAPPAPGVNDSFWYRSVAQGIADGRGFVTPVGYVFSPGFHYASTAQHPPAYAVLLAVFEGVHITGDTAQRLVGSLLGGATVLGVGLLGRRGGGPAVGLAAAAVAAVYPLLVVADGALLSETLYGPIVALLLLAAWRLAEHATSRRAALLGALVGLATLTRSEALLLVVFLALPLAWRGGGSGRLLRMAATVAATVVVLAPWVVRNWITFDRPLLSTNDGTTIAWTNCAATYHGPDLGYKSLSCVHPESGDEAEQAAAQRKQGTDYAKAHLGRLPVVVAARVAGTWSLYRPFRVTDPGRAFVMVKAGVIMYWVLLALAIPGIVALRRHGAPLLILLAPFLVVTLTAAGSYASLRGRFLAEVPLTVLAGAGLVWLVRTLSAAWGRRAPAGSAPAPSS
jgi:4-amino-4-deoxy-L-arabinose transferase-like glycosyltransferase